MEGVNDAEAPSIGLDSSEEAGHRSSSQTGTTPEPLFYVLPYLGLRELLTFQAVSKQLREAIRGDVTLWQQIHVDVPLNRNLTDAELTRLLSRSPPGRLRALSLIKCTRISESLIEDIVEANPLLQKLNLSGCTGVSVEAVLRMVKMQRERCSPYGLTQLRIRGLYGVTSEILDSLLRMMQPESHQPSSGNTRKTPQYYKNGEPTPGISEGQLIDIEACPKCKKPGLVFDCTRPMCEQQRNSPLQQCRGCYLCIARCEECGMCIDGDDYEETFCMEILCQSCWLRLPKCSECNRAGCSRHLQALHVSKNTIFSCDSCQGILPGETGPIFD